MKNKNTLDIELIEALAIPREKGITVLVGGGGKTSLMYRLGAEYAKAYRTVIVTTTTCIAPPESGEAVLIEASAAAKWDTLVKPGEVVCVGTRDGDSKLHGIEPALWERCVQEAERVFAEGDGAKMLPVKAPVEYEPVIPEEADTVIAVTGLTALGRPLREVGFRLERLCQVLNVTPDTVLTPRMLARLLTSEQGQFKNVNEVSRFRIFLNQADDVRLTEIGLETANVIKDYMPECRVVVGCLRPKVVVREVL